MKRRYTGRTNVVSISTLVGLLLKLTLCQSRHISAAALFGGPSAAAIFGLGSKDDANQQSKQQRVPQGRRGPVPPPPPRGQSQGQQQLKALPPPPPPPMNSWDNNRPPPVPMRPDEASIENASLNGDVNMNTTLTAQQGAQQGGLLLPPPPPPLSFYPQQQQHQQQHELPQSQFPPPPPPPGWGPVENNQWMEPPPPFPDWQQAEYRNDEWNQGFNDNNIGIDSAGGMQRELDDSMQREQALLQTVQNMTRSIAGMEQREELHVRQLDVLTERVMDVEASAADDHNAVLEYQANCTLAGQEMAVLQGEVDEWKTRCGEFVEQHDKDDEVIQDLELTLKRASRRAEDLAGMIERHRLQEEEVEYKAKRKQKKKSRGFIAWMFGWGADDEEEDWDEMHEAARSTLLKALQTERNSVDELESAVSSLQQNNSAIVEQVESRDLIINELNDRVAVFEEDKVVLKAALRQLQKEMNDEAPKTQKLVNGLGLAQKEVERLRKEIESLVATHQKEIGSLQKAISKKQSKIQQTESNLTVIGTYVDKLEERLADFAVARRDIEVRERKCNELDTAVIDAERERDAMRARVETFETEHEELKELLGEIARERSKLMKQIGQVTGQRDKLQQQGDQLRQSTAASELEIRRLQANDEQWRAQARQLESELGGARNRSAHLEMTLQEAEPATAGLQVEVEAALQAKRELQERLEQSDEAALQAKRELQEMLDESKVAALQAKSELQERLDKSEETARQAKSELQALLDQSEANKAELQAKIVSLQRARVVPEPPKKLPVRPDDVMAPPTKNTTKAEFGNSTALVNSMATAVLSSSAPVVPPINSRTVPAVPPPPPRLVNATGRPPLIANSTARVPPNATARPVAPASSRKVPLRKVRKFFSQRTGLHGVFTEPSRRRLVGPTVSKPTPPSEKQRPDVLSHTLGGLRAALPKMSGKTKDPTVSKPKSSTAATPPNEKQRPGVLTHTLGGLRAAIPKKLPKISFKKKDPKPKV